MNWAQKYHFINYFISNILGPALTRLLYPRWQCLKELRHLQKKFCGEVGIPTNKPCIMCWNAYKESKPTANLAVSQMDFMETALNSE